MEHIKTIISRKKLHNKDFTRDSIEKIKIKDKDVVKVDKHKALIDILTLKYIENNSI
ncbi:hypothetical protein [Clostridium botulinum]|uniref:hypothetical protein n=1 Tax=Clostridium botulinum TaxID=1491 RepID=UPI00135F18DD|nr:hypothetical protein [Clostridium botulinum]